jgi:hypothetical protein
MSNREKFLMDLAQVLGKVNEIQGTEDGGGDILGYAIMHVGCYYPGNAINERSYKEHRLEMLYRLHSMIMRKCSCIPIIHPIYKNLVDALYYLHKEICEVKNGTVLLEARVVDPSEFFDAGPYDGE